MHVCATYFLPLEDPGRTWDWQKVYEMITWHDIDEIETGDTIGYLKTDADRAAEAAAEQKIIDQLPEHLKAHITALLAEYKARDTVEAKFVKAIDKIEPQIHLYHEEGKELVHRHGTYYEDHRRIKEPYVRHFPHVYAFSKVIMQRMLDEGFFADERPKLFEPRKND
jgi:Predicted hydrolases of HD superfamily